MLGTSLELSQFVGKKLKLAKLYPYRDGEPCKHVGCLSHVSHPCEGCGRVKGFNYPDYATNMVWIMFVISAMQTIDYECEVKFFLAGTEKIPLSSACFIKYGQNKRYCGTSQHPPLAILQAAVEALEDMDGKTN